MNKEVIALSLSKQPSHILEKIVKSLSGGVSLFLNDENDFIRLEAAKTILDSRKLLHVNKKN